MTWLAAIEFAVASTVIESIWQVAILGVTAWLVLSLLSGRSAALRHMVGMGFLLACIAGCIVSVIRILTATERPSLPMIPDLATIAPPEWISWMWAAGVALKLIQLTSSWTAFRQMERQVFQPLPAEWHDRFERLRLRVGIVRHVEVRLLAGMLPCSARLLRPVVWLPTNLFTRLTVEQVEAVLAHELAHVRRLDWLWNGLQSAADALFFYHPAVWWLSDRIRQDRENACDDLAVSACGDTVALAEALGRLETMRAPVFVLSSRGGSLMKRISRLLMPAAEQPARFALPIAALAVAGAVAVVSVQLGASARNDDSPRWWQLHGDSMQVNGTLGGETRSYASWHGSDGQRHERYLVGGQARPIDAAAREWINISATPPAPPSPPAPPRMHQITDEPLYRNAVRDIPGDRSLIAQLGTPVAVAGTDGPSYMDDSRVSLRLEASGPNGRVRIHRLGSKDSGTWTFWTADVEAIAPASQKR